MQNNNIKIFPTPSDLAMNFAKEMVKMINDSKERKPFTIALSGGTTPELLFKLLAEKFSKSVSWEFVHFFWGDERCVPPDSDQSNFGMTMKELLSKIEIPSVNIHRIKGEDDPEAEAIRYSREIKAHTPSRDGLPLFDLVMLGLGEDGHTASIFPGSTDLFLSEKICTAVQQPITNQKRITLTGRVINNCDSIFFLVTGKKKAGVVEKMFKKNPAAIEYPASYIVSVYGRLIWFLDKDAGSLL